MERLEVSFGSAARDTLCAAFDAAQVSIDAEFYSITDPKVIAALNAASQRNVAVNLHVEGNPSRFGRKPDTGERTDRSARPIADSVRSKFSDSVHVVIENDPIVLVHGKAAVVDGRTAYISTANPTVCGFESPGEVLVVDRSSRDVAAVQASISGTDAAAGDFVVTGPAALLRSRVSGLMDASSDVRVATEDLSDREVVNALAERNAAGHHDRILIEADGYVSRTQRQAMSQLRNIGVDIRTLPHGYMHEKYVDAGDQVYVGSANLTRNGLDEAREIGIVAPAAAFGSNAGALRRDFDRMWSNSVPA